MIEKYVYKFLIFNIANKPTPTRTNGGNSLREEQPRARASLVKWHWLGLGEEEGCQFIVGALVPASGSSRY